jgi:TonB family protein
MRTPGTPRTARAPTAPPAPAPTPAEGLPPHPEDPDGVHLQGGQAQAPQAPALPPMPQTQPGAPASASPGAPSLVPSQQQLARAIGSGTEDYLRDIDEGDQTVLNAKKWKFATFFNRVKQQVREHWRPAEVYQKRDPSRSIYGTKDRYTLLRVQLKPDGSLANVALETPSGVEFLDDEAIEAFKQAQPFPNPPAQLVEPGGLISFRFGFYFEISGAPKFRVFRYGSGSM